MKEYSNYSDLPGEIKNFIKENLFFSNEYFLLMRKENNNPIILLNEDFIIPFIFNKKLCFNRGYFLYEPIPLKENISQKSMQEFLDKCLIYLKEKKKVHFITLNPAYTNFKIYPTNSIRIPFANYICNLSLSEDELIANMHSKHRNVVKKAIKDGVVVKSGNNEFLLKDYIKIDNMTWKRSNKKSMGIKFYKKRIECIPNNCKIYIAYLNDEPQAGAFIYFDKNYGYYMFGASIDHPHTGSGNLLQWEIIKSLKRKGLKSYSFVGCRINEDKNSKYHEIQRFKQRFGGEFIEGYMFKSILNVFMYKLFLFLYKIRGKVSIDAVEEEKDKWKELNS